MKTDRQTLYFNEPVPHATPYQRARQHWDERMGSARVQAANWRIMAFCLFGLVLLSWGMILWQMQRAKVIPFVVEVARSGAVRSVGPAHDHYQPRDEQIAFHLAAFITRFRSLSADPVIVRKNWLTLYHFVSDNAATTLTDYARKHDPFAQVGKRTIAVDVVSVVRASNSSFQVRWKETAFVNGAQESSTRYTGLMTLTLHPPTDKKTLLNNPLGIFITDLNWSRDLTPGTQP